MASVPSQVRHLIDRAVRIASTRRTVTCVILPNDLQGLPYEDPPMVHGTTHTGIGYAGPAQASGSKPAARRRRRVECRQKGRDPRRRGGAERDRRSDRGRRTAYRRASPRRCSGKAVLPDDLPYVTGSLGLARNQAKLGHDARTATRS